MNEAAPGLAPPAALLLVIAFALAGPVMALAPLGMAPLLIAVAVLATLAERIRGGRWPALPSRATAIAVLFLAWCTLTLIWALDRPSGARKLVDMVLVFAAA